MTNTRIALVPAGLRAEDREFGGFIPTEAVDIADAAANTLYAYASEIGIHIVATLGVDADGRLVAFVGFPAKFSHDGPPRAAVVMQAPLDGLWPAAEATKPEDAYAAMYARMAEVVNQLLMLLAGSDDAVIVSR